MASGASGAGASAGVGGGSVCGGADDCGACVACAWEDPCLPPATTCAANQYCVALVDCYASCAPDDCDSCWVQHPLGQAAYLALAGCTYCDACPAECVPPHFSCTGS